jgi:hypothetical protein
MILRNRSPFGRRVGTVMRAFKDEWENMAEFSSHFEDMTIRISI